MTAEISKKTQTTILTNPSSSSTNCSFNLLFCCSAVLNVSLSDCIWSNNEERSIVADCKRDIVVSKVSIFSFCSSVSRPNRRFSVICTSSSRSNESFSFLIFSTSLSLLLAVTWWSIVGVCGWGVATSKVVFFRDSSSSSCVVPENVK